MMKVFAVAMLLGATLDRARFRALALVPIMAVFLIVALGMWSPAPVVAAGGVQVGYLLGGLLFAMLL